MDSAAADLAHRLARNAEAVCRHYLPNGRRVGRYWLVGDVDNTPGRSLYVRLSGSESGKGAAGKWSDAATGEHGDLLDLIAARKQLNTLCEALDEARRFLALPHASLRRPTMPAAQGSPEAARRLWAMAQPIVGTLAEAYLRSRALTGLPARDTLRFHSRCYYRGDESDPRDQVRDAWPALLAAVTDARGHLTGLHRTWLDPSGNGKAPVSTPRRSMGLILGHGVRLGLARDVLAAGEGLETMLSLCRMLPDLPMIAAGSANHLDALLLPESVRRLYVAEDGDPAGRRATGSLIARAVAAGIDARRLIATFGDFNDDLRQLGSVALFAALRVQLDPEDVTRFMLTRP
jgi:hypothetical protein